jgi:hypothetical protein
MERNPMIGSRVTDLLNWYSSLVDGHAIGIEKRFYGNAKENSLWLL